LEERKRGRGNNNNNNKKLKDRMLFAFLIRGLI
jgi:hypothetical protein